MANQSRTRQAIATIARALPKERILGLIAEGMTIRRIAALIESETGRKFSPYYVGKALKSYGEDYEQAKYLQAQNNVDRMQEITENVVEGKIDPASARIASDNYKWLAAKQNPREFGDKIQAEIQVTDMTQLHLQALRTVMQAKTVQARLVDKGKEEEEEEAG